MMRKLLIVTAPLLVSIAHPALAQQGRYVPIGATSLQVGPTINYSVTAAYFIDTQKNVVVICKNALQSMVVTCAPSAPLNLDAHGAPSSSTLKDNQLEPGAAGLLAKRSSASEADSRHTLPPSKPAIPSLNSP